jgi:1-pyrroline-5-carboxylate dehydrogenase
LTKAANWEEAIEIYNETDYGLTGAFFSENEERIQRALATMHCGNLYINKKCTGALVGVHPFGGFNMSGTDSKAGGYDYLLLFTQGKMTARKQK